MRKLIKVNILFRLLFLFIAVRADNACMDNSRHLKKPFDNKSDYYTDCTCRCSGHTQVNGICTECKHFRYPKDLIIVDKLVRIKTRKPDVLDTFWRRHARFVSSSIRRSATKEEVRHALFTPISVTTNSVK